MDNLDLSDELESDVTYLIKGQTDVGAPVFQAPLDLVQIKQVPTAVAHQNLPEAV